MEEVRLQLAAAGRSLRRINQAFFAFSGVYGTRPTTSSPIGPLLQQLRAASPTLRDFVAQVRAIDSLVELEALLAAFATVSSTRSFVKKTVNIPSRHVRHESEYGCCPSGIHGW